MNKYEALQKHPELARFDFRLFCEYVFMKKNAGFKMIPAPHIDLLCKTLTKVVTGKIKRLVITICPRSGKTELAVVNFVSWCFGLFPDSEFILASAEASKAEDSTYFIRGLVESEYYKRIFPNTELMKDSFALKHFRTTKGGSLLSVGALGNATGYGAGKKVRNEFGGAIIIDDPHKVQEADSQVILERVRKWFLHGIYTRRNNIEHTPVILVQQRVSSGDLAGFLIEGGDGQQWHHINIPARTETGGSFWPEKFPLEDLERLERHDPRLFYLQYMQDPTKADADLFKEEYIRYWQEKPLMEWMRIYADTAQKTSEKNDYSVFTLAGKSIKGECVVLDMIRGRWEAPELLARARSFWDHCKNRYGLIREMVVEDKASGTGLIQQLQREQPRIPVRGLPRNKDKISRMKDVLPFASCGNLILPARHELLSEIIKEIVAFPSKGVHDDTVDTILDALFEVSGGSHANIIGLQDALGLSALQSKSLVY